MSWSACTVTVCPRISAPLAPICFNVDAISLEKWSLCCDSTLLDPPCSLKLRPRDTLKATSLDWVQGEAFSRVASYTPSLPLKPQGLNGLSVRGKIQAKTNFTHELLLTSISSFLLSASPGVYRGQKRTEGLSSHCSVFMWHWGLLLVLIRVL